MFRNNNNIIGFLQKKAFFTRSPSPSPSHSSRFNTNSNLNKSSNHQKTPPKPSKYQSNKTDTKTVMLDKNAFDFSSNNNLNVKGDT